eukprot:CAMPEP_0114503178 /NCGR_PEP_ID=MMETSP0109-20121206/9503_1 /TAXON_ID=29199 /ORGANISM="Chlorarachnion reptans, Strain CCCM449" /LENGTH=380 /DNA_ID=CAMNT_0001681177 /DNA_START=241 /DNA_END=1383 /DNA_ORIENTATION=+
MSSKPRRYVVEGLSPPKDIPEPYASARMAEPDRFDPKRHLCIELPQKVKTLDFKNVGFPYSGEAKKDFPGLAYTEPFRLLSDEGVRALKAAIASHKERFLSQNVRNMSIRGLSYLSDFVREFCFCPEVNAVFSELAGEPLWPHNMAMNHGHTNYGLIGTGRAVDQWHVDSTDYVFVLILSDIRDMEGGELQVLQMPDSSGTAFDKLQQEGIPEHLVETVNYSQAGYCIFMQGSKILHSVTPVLKAREPRISFVQSFSNRNVFAPDKTRMSTFLHQSKDPPNIVNLEFARHKAWRIMGQMRYIQNEVSFDDAKKKVELAKLFKRAGEEMMLAHDLLLGKKNNLPGFIVNKEDKVVRDGHSSIEYTQRKDRYATKTTVESKL